MAFNQGSGMTLWNWVPAGLSVRLGALNPRCFRSISELADDTETEHNPATRGRPAAYGESAAKRIDQNDVCASTHSVDLTSAAGKPAAAQAGIHPGQSVGEALQILR
jgi:hypothetical protein